MSGLNVVQSEFPMLTFRLQLLVVKFKLLRTYFLSPIAESNYRNFQSKKCINFSEKYSEEIFSWKQMET